MKKISKNKSYIAALSIILLVAAAITISFISGNAGVFETLLLGSGGCCYASMAVVGNIGRVGDKETSGKQIAAKVWLVSIDQIDANLPFPVPNANFELGQIPLKQGEYMHYFEAVDDSLEDKSSGSKGDVTTNVTNTFNFIMGGNRIALQRFMEDHPGDRFIIIYQMASDRQYYVLGNDIKPMILKSFERSNGKDNRSVSLTFENASFEQPKKYIGNIIQDTPAVLPANASTIAFTHKAQYTTGVNTDITIIDDFTGLEKADDGRVVEIIGGGGDKPSVIEANSAFVLRNDETWTANAGSRLSLRVLDKTTLVEVDRVQTA